MLYRINRARVWTQAQYQSFRSEWPHLKKNVLRICAIYRPFLFPLIVITVLSLGSQACLLAIPFFIGKIIEALFRGEEFTRIVLLSAGMVASFTFLSPIQFLQDINRNRNLDIKNRWHLTNVTFKRLLTFSLRQIAGGNSGLRQATIGKGEYAVHEIVRTFVKEFTPPFVKILFTFGMLLACYALIGQVSAVLLVVYGAVSFILNVQVFPELKKCEDLDEKVDAEHAELLTHLELIITSAEETRALDEFNRRYAEFQKREEALWVRYYTTSAWLRDPIIIIGFMLVTAIGIYLIRTGVYKPGDFAVIISWSVALFTGLAPFAALQRKFMRHYSMVRRYFEMLDQPPETATAQLSYAPQKLTGRIEFSGVSYTHRAIDGNGGDIPAIKNISFSIQAGQTIGIVGHTGSGKSTLVKAILRWYDPDQGSILVDGVDLRTYNLSWYRKKIGYVPQQVHLFDSSIRRNISMGSGRDLVDTELETLSTLVGIDTFYDRLGSKRFDITVGELGRHLSGGQVQLIGIARALAKDPSILIFDEATASLDYGSEAVVQRAMRTALSGRTGIVIAHRLSTVRHLDIIAVMNHGYIVGIGAHDELMRSCSEYQKLVKYELRA